MISFASMPGYQPAKSGRSWYRRFPTRESAIEAKRALVNADVKYRCLKVAKSISHSSDRRPTTRPYPQKQMVARQSAAGRRNYDQIHSDRLPGSSGWLAPTLSR